jgi:hypothetical protein
MLGVTVASHWNTVVKTNAATDWGLCRDCLDDINQFNAKSGDVGRAALGAVDQLFSAVLSGQHPQAERPKPQPSVDFRDTLPGTPKREPTASNATPAPALSQGARIINTFIAPSKTFTDLRRSASWWAPWLLLSIIGIAFMLVVNRQIGFEQVARNQVAISPRATAQIDQLPPDQQAKQMRIRAAFTRYIGYGIPVLNLLVFLMIAVVLWATFKIAGAADLSFGKAYAIVVYGSLPGLIGILLGIGSLFAGMDKEGFNINNPSATNPAYFMDPAGGIFLYGMASALDIFIIWNIVVMGIGFACNSKVKRSTAIIIVAVLYVIYKLATSGLAAAFS